MKLILAQDDGTVFDEWYVPEDEVPTAQFGAYTGPDPFNRVRSFLEFHLPVYLDRGDYEEKKAEVVDDPDWAHSQHMD